MQRWFLAILQKKKRKKKNKKEHVVYTWCFFNERRVTYYLAFFICLYFWIFPISLLGQTVAPPPEFPLWNICVSRGISFFFVFFSFWIVYFFVFISYLFASYCLSDHIYFPAFTKKKQNYEILNPSSLRTLAIMNLVLHSITSDCHYILNN